MSESPHSRPATLLVFVSLLLLWGCGSPPEEPFVSRARLLNESGLRSVQKGEFEAAAVDFDEALLLAEQSDDLLEQARALNNMGQVQEEWGRYGEAENHYRRALLLNERDTGGSAVDRATYTINLAGCLAQQKRLGESREAFQTALDLAQGLEDEWLQALAINGLSIIDRREGDLDLAYRRLSEARMLFEKVGDDEGMAGADLNIATLLEQRGEIKEAVHRYSLARNAHQRAQRRAGIALSLAGLARCYEKLGQPRNALVWLSRAAEVNLGIPRLDRAESNLREMLRINRTLEDAEEDILEIQARLDELMKKRLEIPEGEESSGES